MKLNVKLPVATSLYNQLYLLASHRLPGDIKFAVYSDMAVLKPIVDAFNNTNNDMVKELGEPIGGRLIIREFLGEAGDQPNPKFTQYRESMKALEDKDIDVEVQGVPSRLFSGDREFEGDLFTIYEHMINDKHEPRNKSK